MLRKAEPFKIKMVEPIKLISREERVRKLKEAGYNPFALRAEDIYIDLLTDSGTGAMSDRQWAAIMMGDESYAGSRSFYKLEEVVKRITGYKYILPVHQGRGAEQVIFPNIIKNKGDYVLNNMHFDTTKAHVEIAKGRAINLIDEKAFNTDKYDDFKGNFDLDKLERFIEEHGVEKIVGIVITVTCNSSGGEPVSMGNIKGVRRIANKYGIKVFFDSARYAENAYFIKQREEGYNNKTILEIAKEMFSYGDGMMMSCKKDGIVNIGGIIAIKDDQELYTNCQSSMVPLEGFPTYGGMAGRDMEALAVGLEEALNEEYLEYRIEQVKYLGDKLMDAGVPIQYPTGGHAVFVDCKKICPHIPYYQYPAQAVCNAVYLAGGIRAVEIGSLLLGRDPDTGTNIESPLELMRLTIPRRVYTNRHMDVVADAVIEVFNDRDKLIGLEFDYEPKVLRHFTARLKPIKI
ncbi:MAG: tryptophanase [Vallitalea sp.]|jgi:tryptophanase|nr:tryptophanase [Vallitalea sp.]